MKEKNKKYYCDEDNRQFQVNIYLDILYDQKLKMVDKEQRNLRIG